jgi:hypothetical protein
MRRILVAGARRHVLLSEGVTLRGRGRGSGVTGIPDAAPEVVVTSNNKVADRTLTSSQRSTGAEWSRHSPRGLRGSGNSHRRAPGHPGRAGHQAPDPRVDDSLRIREDPPHRLWVRSS